MKQALFGLLFLVGCTGLDLPQQAGNNPTPSTAWADATARYSTHQHQAALYAQRCERDQAMFLSNCHGVVRELNGIDVYAEGVEKRGYEALGRGDHRTLYGAIEDLDRLGRELDTILQKEKRQ